MHYLWIGIGGFFGALARHSLAEFIARRAEMAFPLGILIVNASGTFALGMLAGASERTEWVTPAVRSSVMVGFLGAYTTFSTWSVDTLRLFESGHHGAAMLNVAGSALLGLIAAWAGMALGRLIR